MKRIFFIVILFAFFCLFFNAIRIYNYSLEYSEIKSDVAIVLGAGTHNGKISPVFKERINHGIYLYKKGVNTVKAHWRGIVNYIESKINNGILEGINSKIQLAKKRARGYRNTTNFINMIYFIAGKLKFDYPLYLT